MGVITTSQLSAGTVFGPIPRNVTLTDPAYLIGHMTCDNHPDVHTVKLDMTEYIDGERAVEWVPYVKAARNGSEQNLEAYLRDGQLHYRVLHTIPTNSELYIWYSPSLASIIGLPDIQSFHVKDGGVYACPYCMDTFKNPNSLRAHIRFKCDRRTAVTSSTMPIAHSKVYTTYPTMMTDPNHPLYSYPRAYGGLRLSGPLPGHPVGHPIGHPVHPSGHAHPHERPTIPSPTSSTNSNTSAPNSGHSPHNDRHESRLSPPRLSPVKRSFEEDDHRPIKRIATEDSDGSRSPAYSPQSTGSLSPHSRNDRCERSSKLDQNQNVNDASDDEQVSAFRKVEKKADTSPSSVGNSTQTFPLPTSVAGSLFSPALMAAGKTAMEILRKELPPGLPHPSLLPRYPLLPGTALPAPFLPTSSYNENLPLNITDLYKGSLKASEIARVTDKLSDIHNIENNNMNLVPPFVSDTRITNGFPLQYYKPQNPMVEKILSSPTPININSSLASLAVTQNWCAKCNATFRMTSDLVYHMRSHHHRETYTAEKRREDKLKCNICGETFRERHHLTRHMSSHA